MKTNRVRLRTVYEPLTTSCHIYAAGKNGSALTQTYDVTEQEFVPNRALSPLVLTPVITANANDGSWNNIGYDRSGNPQSSWTDGSGVVHKVNGNCFLSDVKWYVDDVEIGNVWASADYSIDNSSSTLKVSTASTANTLRSDTYGTLTIRKNCDAGTKYRIRFEGKIVDSRLGLNIGVVSNELIMQTIARTGDEFSVSMDKGDIEYSIFQDRLLEYDYETAKDIEHLNTLEEALEIGTPYLQKMPYSVYLGNKMYDGGITHQLYKRDGVNGFSLVDLESEDCEILEVTDEYIKIDMRLVHGTEVYRLVIKTTDELHEASVSFNATRYTESYEVQTINESNITDSETRQDKVIVYASGRKLPYPECQFHITWMTDSYNAKGVVHNVGENGVIDMKKANVATLEQNAWLDVYVDIEQRGQAATYTDSLGNVYTNEHYYPFIS